MTKRHFTQDKIHELLEKAKAEMPAFTDPDGVMAYVFPSTTRQAKAGGLSFEEIDPEYDWDAQGPWDIKSPLDIGVEYLPGNLNQFLPADTTTQEWPYNFARWVMPSGMGLADHPIRIFLPIIRNELEAIIDAYVSLGDCEERKEDICHAITIFLMRFNYYFMPTENITQCLNSIQDWRDYLKVVVNHIDADGILNREASYLEALGQELGVEQ